MPSPVLATKLFAPTARRQLVARPRLLDRLDTGLGDGVRLTLVSAPAGFGKTTVLCDWLAHVADRVRDLRAGWLSLDEGDNDPVRLLTHLCALLRSVGVEVSGAPMEPAPGQSASAVLTGLVNDVVRAGENSPETQWVLVLDDYHVIASPDVHEAVNFLVDHAPSCLHVVLATRSDPSVPLSRLRSRGQLSEVRAADLRFTAAEALEFLNQVMGLDLSTADVEALEERTEGWAAGLQLAALSLRDITGSADVTAFIDAFTGSHRLVVDYLADEVLARQPDRIREFLLRTSVLDRLTGSLCDTVTGVGDGAHTLAGLERDNLFLVPLDTERMWYRYHHLFADVLRARLVAEHPDEVPDLHRRASDWYAEHAQPVDAVRHALAAEDFDRAALLIEETLPDTRRARQDGLMLSWIRALPEATVRRSPVLSIVSGWSSLMSGDLEAMERRLDDAEAALAAGARDHQLARNWADTEELRTAPATISVYRASLAQAHGDVEGTVGHARRAMALAGPEDHFVRGAAGGFLGLAAWAVGDVAEALDAFGAAVRSLQAAGNVVDALDSTIVLADMWVASGRPHRARQLYEKALSTATAGGEPFPRATADLHVGLAELDRELDDLAGAEAHLETARVLGERSSITENRHRWYVAMAQLRAATGDVVSAERLLDEAEALYRRGFYPEIRPIPATRARMRIAAGDLESAEAWAHDQGLHVDDDPTYLREYEHLTLVRLLLSQYRSGADGDPSRATTAVEAVLSLLDRMHAAATAAGRAGGVLEIGMLQALAHHARGDTARAAAALEQAQAEAPEPDGYARLYLDEGAPMRALLDDTGVAGEDTVLEPLRRRLDTRATPATGGRPASLADPLSQRELESWACWTPSSPGRRSHVSCSCP